tara:strand:+ start:188 stop:649 length:462 start_codon:yes stop_codon:yes gene_type:complete
MRYHWLLEDVSKELYKCIKDYNVCELVAMRYLILKENESMEDARDYHHECLKGMANDIDINTISWNYYIPFTQYSTDIVSYEMLCAHLNKKCYQVYLKVIASKEGIRVLGDVVCAVIGVNYFKKNLSLRDKISEIHDMKYHMLMACYNNIVLD